MDAGIAVEEHRDRILAAVAPLAPSSVGLADAHGRVLAAAVVAATDVPPFENSAMDGYAVRTADFAGLTGADLPLRLRVVADLPAGAAGNPSIPPGCAVRIMTGAPVPDEADAVVPVEHTDGGTEKVAVTTVPEAAAYVRRAGDDVRAGQVVLAPGSVLGPRALASVASAGRGHAVVHPAPRVGVLATGDELVAPGDILARGQIPDSNSCLLAAAVSEAGGVPVVLGRVADDEDALRELLRRTAPDVDAFVLSGGVSVGAYDVVKAVLAPLGIRFDQVRMQPGRPQGFGLWEDGTPIFALPGNPVSAYVSFEVFVRPALRRMQGHVVLDRPVIGARAEVAWASPAGRRQYLPAVVSASAKGPVVRPATLGGSGSHLVASLARADALAVVGEDVTEVVPGMVLPTVAVP